MSQTPHYADDPALAWSLVIHQIVIVWADATGTVSDQTEIGQRVCVSATGLTSRGVLLSTWPGPGTLPDVFAGPGMDVLSWQDQPRDMEQPDDGCTGFWLRRQGYRCHPADVIPPACRLICGLPATHCFADLLTGPRRAAGGMYSNPIVVVKTIDRLLLPDDVPMECGAKTFTTGVGLLS